MIAAGERPIEHARSAEHHHQREVDAREGAVEVGRDVLQEIGLEDARDAGEGAADHEGDDLVQARH